MGPLVPDIITNELNLVVGFLIGVAFGFILEQAGFSSSRKLTGLFYGTDFTVLRVFFTAGATATTGVVVLSKLGLLDASIIYVNPTFLYSAIAGGLVMGVGFVVGGYCPGTSFCGAAVGRIDAMVFVLGGLAGAFVFGEAYPALHDFYTAGALGDVTVPAALGISPGAFAIALILVAVAAFVVTSRIERRVNPDAPASRFPVNRHRLAAALLIAVGIVAGTMPSSRDRLMATAADEDYRRSHPVARMSADELAFRILDRDDAIQLIDVRTAAGFAATSLPGAVNLPLADLMSSSARQTLAHGQRRKVFFAENEGQADEAATLAALLGYENLAVLSGGLAGFTRTILEAPSKPPADISGDELETYRFRADAGPQIAALIKARGAMKPAEKKARKIVGGCGV